MILRGLPDKMKSLAKREQAPGVIACNVDYGRIGGVDLSHFPIMKESTQIYQDMNELDAQKRARTMPTNQAAANAKFRNRALPSNRFTKEVIK
ncbi:MAG TPA: hypothetical protein VMW36_06160 [Patescibacteria group bacterium]|nr:hypothetical protein [Patescibacteria group bacterium]